MSTFYGRKNELKQLQYLISKKSASLVVITGRRRIGKSRLVEEFVRKNKKHNKVLISGLFPDKGIGSKSQKSEFASQMERELKIPPVKTDDWSDLFIHLHNHTQKGKWIILFDEITWMGYKDSGFLAKLKNAWDLYLKQNSQLILILCGSVSGWIEKNIVSSTGFFGRISLKIHLDELPVEDCVQFWSEKANMVSAYDKLKLLAVTGGVPKYLEEIIPHLSAEENIRKMCFQKEGILFNEFNRIFSDLFNRRSNIYQKIVYSLVQNKNNLQSICDAIGIQKSGVISEYLNDLITAGFLSKDYSWDLKTQKQSRLCKYRIKDNYLRFYLRYIHPNKEKILKNRFTLKTLTSLPGWSAMMGFQFENLVIQNCNHIIRMLGISFSDIVQDGFFFQNKTNRKQGCQIDYMIQTKHGPVYICEIKFQKNPVKSNVIEDVKRKTRQLSVPKYCSLIPVLIHVNGVSDSVEAAEYFAQIIDFSDFILT
ncbi:MAG: ATPase family protein [Candidatus Magnetoglobus multicellularis str. Araruama]|uniref:ATPase family protein n=1 Tax=Candidatus Magnetoglobus multicellularis str. Araruama TaxID=890399 RepID=A0A1V1PFS0_9BACT|nr:MAG: ATPase family protein [Candidatus Magnetoglobus multicellularis str. Araruama]